MSLKQKLIHEVKAMLAAALFFACWIAFLLLFKELLLEEYDLAFHGWSMALIGALILSKVVIILERVSFGEWSRRSPAWVDLVLRTAIYTVGVFCVLALEKGLEGRQESGGFLEAVKDAFQNAKAAHIWVNALSVSVALLFYNAFALIRMHVGGKRLLSLLLSPPPNIDSEVNACSDSDT